MARQGKVARLPYRLKKEVNERLRDGQPARKILAWLNKQPGAISIWAEYFSEQPATAQNLSEWRDGGYKEYLAEIAELESVEQLTDYALQIAERSGASLADGAAAIVAGQIVKSFKEISDEGGMPLDKAAFAVAALQAGNLGKEKLELAKGKHALAEKKATLDREKFESMACEAVLKAAKSKEIQNILGSGETKAVQLDLIHEQLFGKAPVAAPSRGRP